MLASSVRLPNSEFSLRKATAADVGPIVGLLAEDALRSSIDSAAPEVRERYDRAFQTIDADDAQLLVVVTDKSDSVVGTMQLTFIPGMARAGATRLQIEAVRVRLDHRGKGIGGAMINWAISEGDRRGAALVQLTSDRSRTDAHRFYENLGFIASHTGFKLTLPR